MLRTVFLLLLCLSATSVSAMSLAGRFATLNTWQADFVQTLNNKDAGTTTKSEGDRKSTRLNSSHTDISRMPSSA